VTGGRTTTHPRIARMVSIDVCRTHRPLRQTGGPIALGGRCATRVNRTPAIPPLDSQRLDGATGCWPEPQTACNLGLDVVSPPLSKAAFGGQGHVATPYQPRGRRSKTPPADRPHMRKKLKKFSDGLLRYQTLSRTSVRVPTFAAAMICTSSFDTGPACRF
jgi:hypothetical protein